MKTCEYIKREGESCTRNNNCTYPNCPVPKKAFLQKYAKPDDPNISDQEHKELLQTNFYYLESLGGGWYVPEIIDNMTEGERETHHLLLKLQQK